MLVPAILYKEEIEKKFYGYFYKKEMFYMSGCNQQWVPEIIKDVNEGTYQYAVLNNEDKVVGFMEYSANLYASCINRFCMVSFEPGNYIFAKDIYSKFFELIKKFHRIEWRCVGSNPFSKAYDKIVKRCGGTKHILKDALKDDEGNYIDDYIYEIVKR